MFWEIFEGDTRGKPISHEVLVGYDWDTGEEIYELEYEASWQPHEKMVYRYFDYESAEVRFNSLVDRFMDSHTWPWNILHFEIKNGEAVAEFTNNEDSHWFKLKTCKEEL